MTTKSHPKRITAEFLYRFQPIQEPRLSPDGRHVVYAAQRVERKTEKKYTNLWVAPTDRGQPRQFTYGDQNDTHARWSPDGNQIAFLSNRADPDKPAQIFLIRFTGGEARQLTHVEGDIGGLFWSPDGKSILCTVQKTDPDALERQNDAQKKKLGVVARHYDRVFYKLDGYGYLPHERWHLWLVDARTGRARQLTDHNVYDERDPAWSPDGQWIAFISNRSADPDFNPDADDLWVMPRTGSGDLRKIEAPMGGKALPSFSPDGKWIAYYAQEGVGQWYKNTGLWVIPADGSAAPRNLTEKYDLHVSAWTINDLGNPETMPPTWSNDGSTIYFPVTLRGSSALMSISPNSENLQTVIGEGGVVGSFTFDSQQKRLAYFYGKIDDPGQIWLREWPNGESRPITEANRALLRSLDLGQIEEVWYKGPDGNDLQGWILKPPGFDPAKKYPSIMEIHGGPLTQYGWYFMHEFYYLAAQGFVVHFTNPRGGRGYGEKHAEAIYGAWGSVDYADLMAWADVVAKLPYIDKKRMGVTGGSYGGYMTVWIIGHTQRFKAAVTQRCLSNFVSEWGSSDFNWTFQQELKAAQPFADLETYWRMSPIAYIGNAKTPTLVIHNEFDLRCPIEQGEQVFVALKSLGVETEMVRFPDEFHGLSRTGRTDRRIARLNHILRWFEKHLK
jgi:dipeptidyl aminopeptidase/acylaminoacyl peptidase